MCDRVAEIKLHSPWCVLNALLDCGPNLTFTYLYNRCPPKRLATFHFAQVKGQAGVGEESVAVRQTLDDITSVVASEQDITEDEAADVSSNLVGGIQRELHRLVSMKQAISDAQKGLALHGRECDKLRKSQDKLQTAENRKDDDHKVQSLA